MKNCICIFALISCALQVTSGFAAETLTEALASPDRLEADVLRDARSRPDAIVPLLQLSPGDRVADIWAGGGCYSALYSAMYSALFSHPVGDNGEVLVVNNQAYQKFSEEQLLPRLSDSKSGSMKLHLREADNLDLGVETLDAAVIILRAAQPQGQLQTQRIR